VTATDLAQRQLATRAATAARPSVVLALALPLLFLHRRYQPSVSISAGGTSVDVFLSDLAVLAVVVTALLVGARRGFDRLRAALGLWVAGALLLGWILVSPAWAPGASYETATHLVTGLKYAEYALLAPAAALLLRGAADVLLLLRAAVAWAAVATAVALLQFFGAVPAYEAYGTGTREPSLLGIHDFGVLSAAVLAIAFAAVLLGRRDRRLELAAGIAGGLGVVLAAALDAVAGTVVAAVALWALVRARGPVSPRRTLSLALITALVAGGAVSLRGPTVNAFLEFVGLKPKTEEVSGNVQSWGQRVTLAYIGLRVFADHPLVGAGWQSTTQYETLAPYVADAKRRFPDQPAQAFPTPAHPWGVQSAPLQLLADLGAVGFLLALATLALAVRAYARVALRGPPGPQRTALVGVGWLAAALGVSLGVGLVAGIPLDAMLWLAVGLAGALAADAAVRSR